MSLEPPSPHRCRRCDCPLDVDSPRAFCAACAPAESATLEFVAPTTPPSSSRQVVAPHAPAARLGQRYERLELLGRGGMGEVYRARQIDLDRIVALKVILDERRQDERFVARFRREALALARLDHPHVVRVYDFGDLEGLPFLAMEFVRGATLRARLRRGGMPFDTLLAWTHQLCGAVAYAHESGVVHRDLKPENVLVTDDERLKIADFGLAKLVDHGAAAELTEEGAVLGTLRYMAPEQLAGARDVDARADVFSLGVMLYELFVGRVPVGHFAPPSRCAAVDPRWDAPILRALAADPADRFANARELADALTQTADDIARGPAAATADSGDGAPRLVGNLPRDATSFVGREDERRLIAARLAGHRLITLTGPGGIGKSRLAVQVGRDVAERFPGGVWFVPLAEVRDPRHILATLAATLGVVEPTGDLFAALVARLSSHATLLVLDNFEQIVAGAPVVGRLLDASPALRMIVTSRVALRVAEERTLGVGPLPVPAAGSEAATAAATTGDGAAAVALFVERARAARPDFQLGPQNAGDVIEICRRLEGLPLAIELAAARVRLLAPRALAERLDRRLKLLVGGARDAPTRQQTMRGAIAWSYELLTPRQRTLLVWTCAFRGPFTVAAAEQLAESLAASATPVVPVEGEPLDAADVLDELSALVDHSLLRAATEESEPRFTTYETIREFAWEQLTPAGAAALRDAHAEWCLETARREEPSLTSAAQQETLAAWDYLLPDFRAALAWWSGPGVRPNDAVRLVGETWYYAVLRGRTSEAIEDIAPTLDHPDLTRGTPAHSRALHGYGTLCYLRDRPEEARRALQEALAFRRQGEPEERVYATLGNLASVKRATGDLEGAIADLREVLAFLRRTGNRASMAVTLSNLSLTWQLLGRIEEASEAITETMELVLALGDRRSLARQYLNLGRLEHLRGRNTEAERAFQQVRTITRELNDSAGELNANLALANSWTAQGRYDEAARMFEECAQAIPPNDVPSRRASLHIARGYLRSKTGDMAGGLADYRESLRLRVMHADWHGAGETFMLIAESYARSGRVEDAARLLGAETALRRRIGYRLIGPTLDELAATRRTIVERLGESATDELEAAGAAESPEQTLARAGVERTKG